MISSYATWTDLMVLRSLEIAFVPDCETQPPFLRSLAVRKTAAIVLLSAFAITVSAGFVTANTVTFYDTASSFEAASTTTVEATFESESLGNQPGVIMEGRVTVTPIRTSTTWFTYLSGES